MKTEVWRDICTTGQMPWHVMKALFPTMTQKGGLDWMGRCKCLTIRGWRMLWELPESMRTIIGKLWMRSWNFRVWREKFPMRAWGDKWKWTMSSVWSRSGGTSRISRTGSVTSKTRRNREVEHLWPGRNFSSQL